ncbi:MAG: pilus assembly protein PilM [Muribaculaceae bacterium]|nr:pilus assembly protein PilM [Muribaculaceae bacterium]
MEQNQYIVALEIGSSKIVGAFAEKTPSGMVTLTRLVEEKMANCVRYGTVLNVENVKSGIMRILKDIEDSVDGRVTHVYVGVGGRSLHSEVSEVNRSLDATKPITDDIIENIIRDASRNTVKNYETIDVVPRTVYVDKNETKTPVGQIGSSIKIKVNLIVAKPIVKMNLTRVMSMNYGTSVKRYYVTPLVTSEQILSDSERSLGCMLVDIGAETSTVAIYKDSALIYLATLPLGGRNITRDIMNGCSVLEETAERVKQNISNPLDPKHVDSFVIEGVTSSEAASYISARTDEIIANIDKQLDYASVTKDDIRSIVLIGGGSQLQGLAQRMEEKTKVKVTLGQAPKSLNIRDLRYNKPEYVDVLSLVAKAAEDLKPGESCLERNSYEAPVIETKQPDEETTTVKEGPKKPEKKGGFFSKMRKKLEDLVSDPDEDAEDYK